MFAVKTQSQIQSAIENKTTRVRERKKNGKKKAENKKWRQVEQCWNVMCAQMRKFYESIQDSACNISKHKSTSRTFFWHFLTFYWNEHKFDVFFLVRLIRFVNVFEMSRRQSVWVILCVFLCWNHQNFSILTISHAFSFDTFRFEHDMQRKSCERDVRLWVGFTSRRHIL